jgi:molybdopterin-guanine dinucleotide biosynthesis protein MobB
MTNANLPAFGICGWGGSGKTLLIYELARRLTLRGLKIAVIKHAPHGVDKAGDEKDSNHCFRGGADVLLAGQGESLFLLHNEESLVENLRKLAPEYDLILVEGFKSVPLPRKVWLGDSCPPEVGPVTCTLAPIVDRIEIVINMVEDWLDHLAISTPVCAGILFGGASTRMGEPKHLMRHKGITSLEHAVKALAPAVNEVILLGHGEVPTPLKSLIVLPDVEDKQGPLAGMLAAMRWNPRASWLFAACDLPNISTEAVRWLLSMRTPGVWATMPRLPGSVGVEPLLAHYDYRARVLLEHCFRPAEIAQLPQVRQPAPPEGLAQAWINVNTPADLSRL